jgi:hypothetical protein
MSRKSGKRFSEKDMRQTTNDAAGLLAQNRRSLNRRSWDRPFRPIGSAAPLSLRRPGDPRLDGSRRALSQVHFSLARRLEHPAPWRSPGRPGTRASHSRLAPRDFAGRAGRWFQNRARREPNRRLPTDARRCGRSSLSIRAPPPPRRCSARQGMNRRRTPMQRPHKWPSA